MTDVLRRNEVLRSFDARVEVQDLMGSAGWNEDRVPETLDNSISGDTVFLVQTVAQNRIQVPCLREVGEGEGKMKSEIRCER